MALKKISFLLFFCVLFVFVDKEVKGAITLPGLGTEAMGRGTAFTAKADNLSCLWYNPAGLTKLQGFHVGLSAFQNFCLQSFERQPVPAIVDAMNDPNDPDFYPGYFDKDESNIVFFPMPYLAFSYYIDAIDLVVALSPFFAMPLPDLYRSFDAKGAGRYTNFNQEITMFFPQIGIAWKPLEWFSIGATIELLLATGWMDIIVNAVFPPLTPHNTITYINEEGELEINPMVDPTIDLIDPTDGSLITDANIDEFIRDRERPITDMGLNAEAKDIAVSVWGSVGLMFKPLDCLEIGFSFRPPTSIRLEAELNVDSLKNQTGFFDPNRGYNTHSPLHEIPETGSPYSYIYGLVHDESGNPAPLITNITSTKATPIAIVLPIPPAINFGIRYIIDGYGDVELDFSWYGNKIAGPMEYEAEFIIETMIGDYPISDVSTNETNRNDFAISAGTDWEVLEDEFVLRTGIQYAYGTQGEREINGFYDVWHITVGVGFSYIYDNWLKISAAYALSYYPDVSVHSTSLSSMMLPVQETIDRMKRMRDNPNTSEAERAALTEEIDFYEDELLNHIQDGDYSRMDHMVSLGASLMIDWW